MARKLEVLIVGDEGGLAKSIGRSSSLIGGFGSRAARMGKIAALGLAGAGVAAGGLAFKLANLAGDAAEVDSKLKVVFGRSLPSLTKNLDAFSKSTGASRFQLREQAADMGALLRPLTGTSEKAAAMSEQFVKLATDLGSFNNVPTADALLAIRSGLVGEAEPLRRFGVLLNEAAVKAEAYRSGIAKTGAELTEQQKVQARANLIMQQTKLAQGDAERTSGSYANQLKRLKNTISDTATEIGKSLVPGFTSALNATNAFLGRLSDAPTWQAKLGVVGSTIKSAFSRIDWAGLWGDAKDITGKLVDRLQIGIRGADWSRIGTTLGTGIGKSLNFAGQLAKDLTVEFKRAVANINWPQVADGFRAGLVRGITGLDPRAADILIKEFGKGTAASAIRKTLELGFREEIEKMRLPKREFAEAMRILAGIGSKSLTEATSSESGVKELSLVIAAKAQAAAAQAKPAAAKAGASVGQALGAGIATGVGFGGIANSVVAAIEGAKQAARRAAGIKSPSTVWAKEIGEPLGEGIVVGLVKKLQQRSSDALAAVNSLQRQIDAQARRDEDARNQAALKSAKTEKEKAAALQAIRDTDRQRDLDRAQRHYDRLQSQLQKAQDRLTKIQQKADDRRQAIREVAATAFEKLSDKIQRGFGARRDAFVSPAQQQLDSISDRRAQEDMAQAVKDADARVADAIANGGDVEGAMRDAGRAREDIQRVGIEKLAAEQQRAHDQETDALQEQLDGTLERLRSSFTEKGVVYGEGMQAILGVIGRYDGSFAEVGGLLGAKFVQGLAAAMNAAASGGADVRGGSSLSPAAAWRLANPAGGGGGGPTVHLEVHGSVVTENELIDTVREGILRTGARNVTARLA